MVVVGGIDGAMTGSHSSARMGDIGLDASIPPWRLLEDGLCAKC